VDTALVFESDFAYDSITSSLILLACGGGAEVLSSCEKHSLERRAVATPPHPTPPILLSEGGGRDMRIEMVIRVAMVIRVLSHFWLFGRVASPRNSLSQITFPFLLANLSHPETMTL